jgi:hypothetical protein
MKTIEIQKDQNIVDRLSVYVNGEKYVMHHQYLTIQTVDNKPLEIKVKFGGHTSGVIRFEPKDNMALQISKDRRLLNRYWILLAVGTSLASFIGAFLVRTVLLYYLGIPLILFLGILGYEFRNTKKVYTIKEVNTGNKGIVEE